MQRRHILELFGCTRVAPFHEDYLQGVRAMVGEHQRLTDRAR